MTEHHYHHSDTHVAHECFAQGKSEGSGDGRYDKLPGGSTGTVWTIPIGTPKLDDLRRSLKVQARIFVHFRRLTALADHLKAGFADNGIPTKWRSINETQLTEDVSPRLTGSPRWPCHCCAHG